MMIRARPPSDLETPKTNYHTCTFYVAIRLPSFPFLTHLILTVAILVICTSYDLTRDPCFTHCQCQIHAPSSYCGAMRRSCTRSTFVAPHDQQCFLLPARATSTLQNESKLISQREHHSDRLRENPFADLSPVAYDRRLQSVFYERRSSTEMYPYQTPNLDVGIEECRYSSHAGLRGREEL